MLTVNEKKNIAQPATANPTNAYVTAPVSSATVRNLTLEDVWRRLVRQKWMLLITVLTVLLLTAWITWTTTPSWRASATIQIEKEGVQIVNFGALSTSSPDIGEQDPFFRTQYEQLKSRKLAEQVIHDLNLRQRLFEKQEEPSILASLFKIIKRMLFLAEAEQPTKLQDHVGTFAEKLYVEPIEKTHLVKVFYESPDPVLSAEIVNALVNAFIRNNISAQSETDAYAKEFLEQEMEKARSRLAQQEGALLNYAKEHDILDVSNNETSQSRKLDELYSALGVAERNRIQAESRMIQGRKHGNVSEVLGNPVVESLKSNLVDLEAQYQEKLKLFKPAYPDMQRLKGQIDSVRRQLRKEVSGLKQSLKAEYVATKKLEDKLRGELANFKVELVGLRDRSIEYNALKREVETSRNLYDGLLKRLNEVNVAANATSSNIRIVDSAAPPSETFRPKKALNLILGGLVGLMLGTGLALLRETLSQSVASVEELQALSGLPVLGTIPHVRNASESNLALTVVREMNSSVAEAYRVTAASLRFILPNGHAPHTLLVTSVNPAEGKSTSAVSLALTQAQQGMKVLLIDADLRRPTVHIKMGIPNTKGLSNFLNGEADLANITHTFREVNGFYLITAGNVVSDPVKMVSSPAMTRLLQLAVKHFDSIIIDAPPAAGFADAIYLSSMVQSTIIVANEENINRKRLLTVIEHLNRVKRNVAGFLMVKSQVDMMDYRYYDRYQKRIPRKKPSKAQAAKGGGRKGLNLSPA